MSLDDIEDVLGRHVTEDQQEKIDATNNRHQAESIKGSESLLLCHGQILLLINAAAIERHP